MKLVERKKGVRSEGIQGNQLVRMEIPYDAYMYSVLKYLGDGILQKSLVSSSKV